MPCLDVLNSSWMDRRESIEARSGRRRRCWRRLESTAGVSVVGGKQNEVEIHKLLDVSRVHWWKSHRYKKEFSSSFSNLFTKGRLEKIFHGSRNDSAPFKRSLVNLESLCGAFESVGRFRPVIYDPSRLIDPRLWHWLTLITFQQNTRVEWTTPPKIDPCHALPFILPPLASSCHRPPIFHRNIFCRCFRIGVSFGCLQNFYPLVHLPLLCDREERTRIKISRYLSQDLNKKVWNNLRSIH